MSKNIVSLKKAWLVTWSYMSHPMSINDYIVAIFSSRKSEKKIKEFMEFIYLREKSSAYDMALSEKKSDIPYPAGHRNKNITHIYCGENPWLLARKVIDLKIKITEDNQEIISWTEPDSFNFDPKSLTHELVEKGKRKTCILPHQQSLAKDLLWLYNNQKSYTSETSEIENNS